VVITVKEELSLSGFHFQSGKLEWSSFVQNTWCSTGLEIYRGRTL